MKASELQEKLTTLIAKHGDKDIGIYNETECEFDSAYEILPRVMEESDRRGDLEGLFFGITTYAIGDWTRQVDEK